MSLKATWRKMELQMQIKMQTRTQTQTEMSMVAAPRLPRNDTCLRMKVPSNLSFGDWHGRQTVHFSSPPHPSATTRHHRPHPAHYPRYPHNRRRRPRYRHPRPHHPRLPLPLRPSHRLQPVSLQDINSTNPTESCTDWKNHLSSFDPIPSSSNCPIKSKSTPRKISIPHQPPSLPPHNPGGRMV